MDDEQNWESFHSIICEDIWGLCYKIISEDIWGLCYKIISQDIWGLCYKNITKINDVSGVIMSDTTICTVTNHCN